MWLVGGMLVLMRGDGDIAEPEVDAARECEYTLALVLCWSFGFVDSLFRRNRACPTGL